MAEQVKLKGINNDQIRGLAFDKTGNTYIANWNDELYNINPTLFRFNGSMPEAIRPSSAYADGNTFFQLVTMGNIINRSFLRLTDQNDYIKMAILRYRRIAICLV